MAATHPDVVIGRRSFLGGAFAMSAMAALGGCTTVEEEQGSDGAAAVEEAVTLRVDAGEPAAIDPYFCQSADERLAVRQLFDPLTAYDFQTGELCGLAATSWEASSDARTFTFHLREGATFHNGEAVTSSSFRRAWERLVDPQSSVARLFGASDTAYHLALVEGFDELAAGTANGLSGVSCPDEYTLEVSLVRAYADFPAVAAHPALAPVPYVAEADPEAFFSAPVGNGSFMVAAGTPWNEGDELALEPFEDAADSSSASVAVTLVPCSGAEEAYGALSDGDLDVAEVPVDELSAVKKAYGLSADGCTMGVDGRLVLSQGLGVSCLVCNTGAAPLDDATVRRALSLAIDRDYLSDSVYSDVYLPADDIVAPGVPGYRAGTWSYAVHDAERAAELLEPLFPADDEGTRDLALSLVYYRNGGNDNVVDALVSDFRKAGVELEGNALSWDALTTRLADGSFELALFTWTPDYPLMDSVLYPLFHTDAQGSTNFSGFSDEQVDAAIDEARARTDDAVRLALYQDADDLLAEDVPVIPLLFTGRALVASEVVESLQCDPQGVLDLAQAVVGAR